ncbi:MAG: amidohydrolase family protein [Candidatus Binatia bacterium]|nr:amidohydrolase family protein [Candidatus Binatia bacterium]
MSKKTRLPVVLQRRHSDEFEPAPYTSRDREGLSRVLGRGPRDAQRLGLSLGSYWAGRRGTAAGLRAIDAGFDEKFFVVPEAAALELEAAKETFDGDEVVIDVQTHFIADRPETRATAGHIHQMYTDLAPRWWKHLGDARQYDFAEYLRCVFLESETAAAILTSGPGTGPERMLFNEEMASTRELLDDLAGEGRLLNHSIIHANHQSEIEAMEDELERHRPVGWKCYTIGSRSDEVRGWWLDDERTGVPFVEKAVELGVPLICAHKGISALVDNGSPRDVGPIAKAFPHVDFLIYHSGWEIPTSDAAEEGPYTDGTADRGVNRLLHTLRTSGVGAGKNVYAELGSTWFGLIRRPDEAAHVLGKLLLEVGEDNVLWGTDSIWYGPSQVAIDAFRAFQIPVSYQQEFGYPELTAERKAKIFGVNAARVYGIDLERARRRAASDDLAWVKQALKERGVSDE